MAASLLDEEKYRGHLSVGSLALLTILDKITLGRYAALVFVWDGYWSKVLKKVGFPQSKKAVRLLYGFGALLLIAGGSGVVLGEEKADPAAAPRSALYEAVATGDDAGVGQAQQLLEIARERIAKREGLTAAERRVRLTALEDSMGIYVSMIGRLREIKERDPDLGSVEAKTLLKSASVVVERLEERGQAPVPVSGRALVSEGMKGLALLGLISLLAGATLSFPILRAVIRPFRALSALLTAARAA